MVCSALELVKARYASGSCPENRDDPHRLALIIEGGGMRGVISGGMTAALEALGYQRVFDDVFGSSAGAMAAAFFVSGHACAGTTVYYEHLTSTKFIHPLRPIIGKSVMDLGFLINVVFEDRVPLLYACIRRSRLRTHIVATDVDTGNAKVFSDFRNNEEIKRALRASACNPLIAGAPVRINDKPFWDAAISEAIPIRSAADLGCTHFVILRTRPISGRRKAVGLGERVIARLIMHQYGEPIQAAYLNKHWSYEVELDFIDRFGDRAVSVFPIEASLISQNCRDRKKLQGAACDGFLAMVKTLSHDVTYVGNALSYF